MEIGHQFSCLEGHEFPVPVIEDLPQGQAGNYS